MKDLGQTFATNWKRVSFTHHHGVNLMLSSIRSQDSSGIGEFFDLILLINWCAAVKMDVIQLLPLNDTEDDPSPYFACSGMAINPLFLSLHKLPRFPKEALSELQTFNHLPKLAYHDVQSHKLILLRNYFLAEKEEVLHSKDFLSFTKSQPWVYDYALFKVLKELMSKHHWQTWPKEFQSLSCETKEQLLQDYAPKVSFHLFLQYLCYTQLKEVKRYAESLGILLMGDLPILISSDSADVWQYTNEFALDLSAGTPPDVYNDQGQVWGLPIPKWDEMKKNSYHFWKNRLQYASLFYDLYRLDHVLGFFRLFAIGLGEPSFQGKFIPSEPSLWIPQGREILSCLIDASPMLPIAEDLGLVFDGLRETLTSLGICGTKVMRWEKEPHNDILLKDPRSYPLLSLTTVSTHDSETLALWWRDRKEEAMPYARSMGLEYTENLSYAQREAILSLSHQSGSLFHINLLGEYLALFPDLVAKNPEEERINVPGTVSNFNWTYRMVPSLEELLEHKELTTAVRNMIESAKNLQK